MKARQKLIISSLIFMIGSIVNIFFSYAIHNILSGKRGTLKIDKLLNCIGSIVDNKQHLLLFLCLQGFILILAITFFITNMYPYQSTLKDITPDIQTPVSIGQYQHGSAKWLSDKEKNKAFDSFILNPNNKQMKELIESGYDELDFLKNSNE